jgi:hypothetical protein
MHPILLLSLFLLPVFSQEECFSGYTMGMSYLYQHTAEVRLLSSIESKDKEPSPLHLAVSQSEGIMVPFFLQSGIRMSIYCTYKISCIHEEKEGDTSQWFKLEVVSAKITDGSKSEPQDTRDAQILSKLTEHSFFFDMRCDTTITKVLFAPGKINYVDTEYFKRKEKRLLILRNL